MELIGQFEASATLLSGIETPGTHKWLGGPHNLSGRHGEREKKILLGIVTR
jgi:hypothetical protein